jgi:hypothetical protein
MKITISAERNPMNRIARMVIEHLPSIIFPASIIRSVASAPTGELPERAIELHKGIDRLDGETSTSNEKDDQKDRTESGCSRATTVLNGRRH